MGGEVQQTTGLAELILVRPNGERLAVTVAIGHPFPTSAQDWACPVSFAPLHEGTTAIHGQDSFQAICLAIAFVKDLLTSFLADGGQILYAATGEQFPIDAYFASRGARA